MTSPPPTYLSVPARFIATAGGAGYSPLAPGTCGTIVAVPLAALAAGFPLWAFIVLTVGITAIGIVAAELSDRTWDTHDNGRIVIDEVAGYFTTVAFADYTMLSVLLLGFVLFRVFDILKPPPVNWLDENLPGGTGVVLDDIAAGVQAGLVLLLLHLTGVTTKLQTYLPDLASFP